MLGTKSTGKMSPHRRRLMSRPGVAHVPKQAAFLWTRTAVVAGSPPFWGLVVTREGRRDVTRHELAKRGIVSRMRVNVRQRIGGMHVCDRPRKSCARGPLAAEKQLHVLRVVDRAYGQIITTES